MAVDYTVGAVVFVVAVGIAWFGIGCLPCLRQMWDEWQEDRKQQDPLAAALIDSDHQRKCNARP